MPKNRPKNKPPKADPADAVKTEREAAPNEAPQSAAVQNAAADELAAEMATAAKPGPGEEAGPVQSLRDELEQAKDRALRVQAELENYRKRAAREMQEQARYANLPLMRDLLPALDNLDRAIAAAEQIIDAASLLQGVKMVARQLEGVFEKHQCVRIAALEQPFDPHLHEAILQQPSEEHPAGTVVQETQSGYQLHDRVVRPSQVIVSTESKGDGLT